MTAGEGQHGGPWVRDARGGALPLQPRPEEIDFRALAGQLAKIPRFAGATVTPYSVAQHAVLVSDLLWLDAAGPRLALAGLLRDAHEAVTGGVPAPWKRALFDRSAEAARAWRAMTAAFDAAVLAAAGFDQPLDRRERRRVREADQVAGATEARDLLVDARPGTPSMRIFAEPAFFVVRPCGWAGAEALWLQRLDQLRAAQQAAAPRGAAQA